MEEEMTHMIRKDDRVQLVNSGQMFSTQAINWAFVERFGPNEAGAEQAHFQEGLKEASLQDGSIGVIDYVYDDGFSQVRFGSAPSALDVPTNLLSIVTADNVVSSL